MYKKNGIGSTIRIGQEIQCVPYAGMFSKKLHSMLGNLEMQLKKNIHKCWLSLGHHSHFGHVSLALNALCPFLPRDKNLTVSILPKHMGRLYVNMN